VKFKEFKAQVELQTGLHIKVIRTDGGGEYTSFEFEGYLINCGIIHEKTAPHSPEQNGLAEIINRIVVERFQCMLFEANLSAGFWAEVALTATYLINHSPTTRLHNMTPEEAWSGTKPTVTRFRPFGCPAYAHVPKANRTKLKSKTRKCIMLGYEPGTKVYRLWDPKCHCIVKSCDVIFDECINPPAKPETPVDLSEILWNGELEYKGITRVGDGWEEDTASHKEDIPSWASTPDEAAPEPHPDQVENHIPEPPVGPDLPAPDEAPEPLQAPPHRARHSELEMLGPPPDITGPRERHLPTRFRQEAKLPDPPMAAPIPEVAGEEAPQDAEVAAFTEIIFTFAAAADSSSLEPKTLQEALQSPEAREWTAAIEKELESLVNMGTFEAVDGLPPGCKAIGAKLTFRIKRHTDGSVERYKARLVAKGFSQMPGIDFDETFAPVIKHTSISIMCALAVQLKLHFHHLDIDTAFLNGPLEEELYMHMPEGSGSLTGKIVRLCPSIYRLKRASHVWNELLDAELKKISYIWIHADFCIYIFQDSDTICFLAVYVDNMGLLGRDQFGWG
jgi:Reverse transcriptase (RNA-dependent DNA polymerase)